MLGAWFAPDIVRQIGHIRAYSASAAIYAAGILAMALAFDAVGWSVFRFFQGAASAIMFTAAESWIADSTPRSKRGGVMGMYQLMLKLAICGGPLLIVEHAPEDTKPFIWAGLLMVLAVVPLCATRRAQPVLPDREALSLNSMMKIPPAALAGAVVAGLCNTGVTSQLPLYAQDLQPGAGSASAATLYIAAMMGGTVTQWPAGLLSDKLDRRLIVAALSAIALAACVALYLTAGKVSFSITVLLSALWGAGALSFYSVSAAHATDRTESGQIAQVMSGMLFVWAGGSVIGPILTGAVADTQAGQPGSLPPWRLVTLPCWRPISGGWWCGRARAGRNVLPSSGSDRPVLCRARPWTRANRPRRQPSPRRRRPRRRHPKNRSERRQTTKTGSHDRQVASLRPMR
jgi:MFS family permease